MVLLLAIILTALLSFLDRWGGGGYTNLSWPFNRGLKAARRYGIPVVLWLQVQTVEAAIAAGFLAVLFSLNLNFIAQRRGWLVVLWGLALFACLLLFCGPYGLIPMVWWIVGVYLSNYGLRWGRKSKKLDWKYVELVRGALIGVAYGLNLFL